MSERIKILVCGKNQIACDILSYLCKFSNDIEINSVCIDKEQHLANVFGDFGKKSNELGIPLYTLNYKNQQSEYTSILNEFKPDLIISAQFSLILSKEITKKYEDRIINFHFSPLPLFRGVSPISHSILMGSATFGITCHLIDSGIDTGPIIDQEMFSIKGLSNIEVYHLCEVHSLTILRRSWPKIRDTFKKERSLASLATPQDDRIATNYKRDSFSYTNNIVDFNQSSFQVVQFALAHTFPPINYPILNYEGNVLRIISCKQIVGHRSIEKRPGTIIKNQTSNAYHIATRDLWVEVIVER